MVICLLTDTITCKIVYFLTVNGSIGAPSMTTPSLAGKSLWSLELLLAFGGRDGDLKKSLELTCRVSSGSTSIT